MVQISFSKREILVKIVYYGMGLCGKTTSLQYLHSVMDPVSTTKLFSVKTDEDRTLFFDFLPITISTLNNFKIKLKIYTVPGQVKYNATRKAVLAGVDGVVFVVDSQQNLLDDNVASMKDLVGNLNYYKLNLDNLPVVFQYNKRDLSPLTPMPKLNDTLNPGKKIPYFPSVAIRGEGVTDAFLAICDLSMKQIIAKHKLPVGEDILDSFLLSLRQPIENKMMEKETESDEMAREDATVNIKLDSISRDEEEDENTSLLRQAVTSNLQMADLYDELEGLKKSMELRVKEMITANKISSTMLAELETDRVIQLASEAFQRHGDFGVSILLDLGPDQELKEAEHTNLKDDPLNHIILESGLSAARAIIQRNRVVLLNRHKNPSIFEKVRGELPEIKSVVCIPLVVKGKSQGIINLYSSIAESFRKDTLTYYHLISNNIAIALENARLYRTVSRLNRTLKSKMNEINRYAGQLEEMVSQRTSELQASNTRLEESIKKLETVDKLKDDFMGLMSHELRTPLTSIISYSQSMLEGIVTEESDKQHFLDVIFKESRHLSTIIERVIDTVNFENGRAYIEMLDTELDGIVEHVLENQKETLRKAGVTVLNDVGSFQIMSDPSRAEQVIEYVMENAIQHSPEGGSISLTASPENGFVRLCIQDEGAGVPLEFAEMIFDRFKLMEGLDHHTRGLRLSLHLSRLIMRAVGGNLALMNPGGKGARFCLDFKLV
ncbi:MAG: GAF domain-containing protein [Acidobacteria bacterium]|nr:GAF domain-containing protein [Acidobacteriota bacterium]